jgi:hypothetical protein
MIIAGIKIIMTFNINAFVIIIKYEITKFPMNVQNGIIERVTDFCLIGPVLKR